MKKDIIKRDQPQNKVLYEPQEPLFPPLDRRARLRRAARALFGLAVLTAAVVVCVCIGVSAADKEGGGTDTGSSHPADTVPKTESNHNWQGEVTEQTNADAESETEMPLPSESENIETQVTQDPTENDKTEPQATESAVATDVSEIDKGEGYVVNYTAKKVDVQGLLDRGFIYSEPSGSQAPLVLVIHTHTSEQYSQYGGTDRYKLNSVVAAGERIALVLNARGLSTVHCTVIHDGDDTNAYLNARDTIRTMLKIYPTIKYVIDVHRMVLRDSDGNEMRTQTTLDGAAQIRLTVSTDIKREGAWQDDVSLALSVRSELNDDGQKVCAPVVISHGGYNGDLCRFFLMADIGSSCDSVAQAMNAAQKLGNAFADVVMGK